MSGPLETDVPLSAGDSAELIDCVVLGGGIAGLSAAYAAHRRGWSVRVLETRREVGGKVHSERKGGYLLEWGPNSFLGSHHTIWQLIADLGLQNRVISAQLPADRFIYRNRRARRLPTGFLSLLTGDFMSFSGKMRMLAEPFIAGGAKRDDSVLDFAKRRLGEEAAQYLVTPFVSGVYAGDAAQLGAADAFPRLWNWEHAAGSIVLGALFDRRKPTLPQLPGATQSPEIAKKRGMFNFDDGFAVLPRALAAALPPDSVILGELALQLQPQADGTTLIRHGARKDGTETHTIRARRVVLALPPRQSAQLLKQFPIVADALAQIELCRVAVVHLGGPDPKQLAPRGFGVLIPPSEGLRTLGILLPSSIFAGRAPPGHWLCSGFIGGARDPDVVDLPDETLVSLVMRAHQQAFGHLMAGQPLQCDFHNVVRWREAIPQYSVGHRALMQQALQQLEKALPNVTLAGNYLDGISVNDAAASGLHAVEILARAEVSVVPPELG